jgi:hypothetical protein
VKPSKPICWIYESSGFAVRLVETLLVRRSTTGAAMAPLPHTTPGAATQGAAQRSAILVVDDDEAIVTY